LVLTNADLFLHDTPSGPKKLIISILGSAATKESAELLYKLIDDGLLIEVGNQVVQKSLSVRQTEELVKRVLNPKPTTSNTVVTVVSGVLSLRSILSVEPFIFGHM
jgi:hypothetical protein